MEVPGSAAWDQGSRLNQSERQARFIMWVTDLFTRADSQGIRLEPLTESEMEWIRRM